MKKELESVVEKAKKEKENLDVKEEFNKVASEYVKKSEFGDQLTKNNHQMTESLKKFGEQQDIIQMNLNSLEKKVVSEYVKKSEFGDQLEIEQL